MNKEKLIELKNCMKNLSEYQILLKQKKDQFELENKELIDRIINLNLLSGKCKEVLWPEAEAEYLEDGVKKRAGGIGIRVSKVLGYDDDIALAWAKEKDLCLQLDTKAFESFAKGGEIDFVKINDKITVTFPKEIKIEND